MGTRFHNVNIKWTVDDIRTLMTLVMRELRTQANSFNKHKRSTSPPPISLFNPGIGFPFSAAEP